MSKLRKENFSFDISGMVDYVSANETELMTKVVIGSNMTEFVSIFPEIKNSEYVPTFESGSIDSILSTGHCSTDFGDIVLDEAELKVCSYNIQKGYCSEKLATTIMGLRLQPGSYNEETGAEEAFLNDLIAKAAVATERKIWQGETPADCVAGLNAQLDAASATTVNVTYTAMTPTNALTVVDSYVTALPDALQFSPTVLFLNRSDYQALLLALRDANFFHYSVEGQTESPGSVMIPATNTVAVSSEIGASRALLTYGKNIAYGTDLLEDSNNADMWFSKDQRQLRMSLQFRAGAKIFFPSLCVRIS